MRALKIAFAFLVALTWVRYTTTAAVAQPACTPAEINTARTALQDAYGLPPNKLPRYKKDAQNNRGLCDLLDPSVQFRGSLFNRWTQSATTVVAGRWNANSDCDCTKSDTCRFVPKDEKTGKLKPLSAGYTGLVLTPNAQSVPALVSGVVTDTGTFVMGKGAESVRTEPDITGKYVLNWVKVNGVCQISCMDMCATSPTDNSVGHKCTDNSVPTQCVVPSSQ